MLLGAIRKLHSASNCSRFLLGREPVQLDVAGTRAVLAGKTVLITGAGGSIGSELCRQVARFPPARLVPYELSEFNLYTIEQDLGERFPACRWCA